MLRLGIAGLAGIGLLAGCVDATTASSETSGQALGTCGTQMPQIVHWNGTKLVPSSPSSVFVAFWVSSGKSKVASADEQSDRQLVVVEGDSETGDLKAAQTDDETDDKFKDLAENLVALPRVRLPGNPPDPCNTNPYLCGDWVRAVMIRTDEALLKAADDYKACQ